MALFPDTAPEVMDIRFVRENLSPIQSLEVLVELEPNAFKRPAAWRQLAELEARLADIPEVMRVDSLLPLLKHMYTSISGVRDPFRSNLHQGRNHSRAPAYAVVFIGRQKAPPPLSRP